MSGPGRPLLEVCVDGLEALERAQEGGADRIELCSRLDLDGLSPGPELLEAAIERARVPLHVMVRPRPGPFEVRPGELDELADEVAGLALRGVPGVVFGFLTPEGEVDRPTTARLVAAARPASVTFHRAFDRVRDPGAALEALVELGVDRLLTSGCADTAHAGRHTLGRLVERARGRLVVMAGGGVRAHLAEEILSASGVRELHASVPFVVPRFHGQ